MSAVLSHPVNVEEKLFQNRYKVDHGRPHIQIRNADVCSNECESQACTFICPYGRFQSALLDENTMVVAYDNPRGDGRARV